METLTTPYQTYREMIHGNRTSKKLGNNTYVHVVDAEAVAVRLHRTDVVTFRANGDVMLNSGGWRTVTTKARMNEYLSDWYISQEKGVWYVGKRSQGWVNLAKYEDGIVLKADGTIEGGSPVPDKKAGRADTKLKKAVRAYCTGFGLALQNQELSADTSGDCFFCQMRTVADGRPLGEAVQSTDHLKSHIEENYFVLTLLDRAIEQFPVSRAAEMFLSASINKADGADVFAAIGRAQVEKSLYRYICRAFGFAS